MYSSADAEKHSVQKRVGKEPEHSRQAVKTSLMGRGTGPVLWLDRMSEDGPAADFPRRT